MMRQIILIAFFVVLAATFISSAPVELSTQPGVIEGDIVYTKNLQEIIADSKRPSAIGNIRKRKVIRGLVHYWPGGILPYVIDATIPKSARKAIRLAFRHLQAKTCLKFVPRTSDHKDYVLFASNGGCFSSVGRQGGEQKVSVDDGCALHEILHTLGFFHEHSRYDRDKYVKVLWWNIAPGMGRNFIMYSHDRIDDLGFPYDVTSIMHYPNNAFSVNGRDTLQKIGDEKFRFGGQTQLSDIDVKQLLALYKCKQLHWKSASSGCVNKIPGCDSYSLKSDSCEANFSFMSVFCKKSCGFCGL